MMKKKYNKRKYNNMITRGKNKNVITLRMKRTTVKMPQKKERKLCVKTSLMKKRIFKERG